jgi:hypothetical protein
VAILVVGGLLSEPCLDLGPTETEIPARFHERDFPLAGLPINPRLTDFETLAKLFRGQQFFKMLHALNLLAFWVVSRHGLEKFVDFEAGFGTIGLR